MLKRIVNLAICLEVGKRVKSEPSIPQQSEEKRSRLYGFRESKSESATPIQNRLSELKFIKKYQIPRVC